MVQIFIVVNMRLFYDTLPTVYVTRVQLYEHSDKTHHLHF